MKNSPQSEIEYSPKKWNLAALIWILAALIILYPVTRLLNGTLPVFTFLFLAVPLTILMFNLRTANIGFRAISWNAFLKNTALCFAGTFGLTIICEPWSHTYQTLLRHALSTAQTDTTFGWLVRFPSPWNWILFILYAGLITLFAEELFFRGWLLNVLKRKMNDKLAVLLQAFLFTLPQALAAFLLPLTQGILYAVVYSFLTIGLLGGWVAHRTGSIWPSLASATFYNLIMCLITFPGI